jgi:ferredoxin--NADP+ reductase
MPQHVIHSRRILAEKVHEFWVEAPLIARKRKAGQFVIVRMNDRGERIPLTIASGDAERGLIRLIVQEAGKSTIEMGRLQVGDFFLDIAGPLGRPTHIETWGNLIAVAGGVGAAPLLPIVEAARAAGNRVHAIIGARSENLMILAEEYARHCHEVRLCSDDGSVGIKGLVTDCLRQWVSEGVQFNQSLIIGPVIMMRETAKVAKELGIPGQVSLNPIMIDGTGMCGACRVSVNGKTKFACVDGPEFDAWGVNFDELILRNRAYLRQEKIALDTMMDHECKIGLATGVAQ